MLRFAEKHLGEVIQYYGYGAEYLPEEENEAINDFVSYMRTVKTVGFNYPAEGGEYMTLGEIELGGKKYYVLHIYVGVPGTEIMEICVQNSKLEALKMMERFIRDCIEEIRERIMEGELEEEVKEHYNTELYELEEQLKQIEKEIKALKSS